jgi:hypothetical protein
VSALTITIRGRSAMGSFLIRSITVQPSISGIIRSRTITRTLCFWSSSSASIPLLAV